LRRLETGRVPQDFFLEKLEKRMPSVVIPEFDAPRAVAKQESDLDSDDEGEVRLFMPYYYCFPF